MSPRRFDGWEPAEVHEFYDAAGERCKAADAYLVLVTREPEWDDAARGRVLRLGEYDATLCHCGCGLPLHIARDPKRAFVVEEDTCHAGRALEMQRAKRAEEEKDGPPRYGKRMYVRPHDPARDGQLKLPERPRGGRRGDQVSPSPTQG